MNGFSKARTVLAAAVLLLTASLAAADQPPAAPADADSLQAQTQEGPLVLERIKSGFVAAPDFKVTDLNHDVGALVGGYAGWLSDETFLVGGAGYWLANGSSHRKMAYGGLLVGWTARMSPWMAFGARGLVGAGEATLSQDVSFGAPSHPGRPDRFSPPTWDGEGTVVRRVIFDQGFFVFEPQGNVVLRLADNVHLDWSVGYRVIAGAAGFEDRLRGVAGSVAVRFGGGQ